MKSPKPLVERFELVIKHFEILKKGLQKLAEPLFVLMEGLHILQTLSNCNFISIFYY